jgi:P4 family phage/plasmid primase-like protien
VARTHTSTKNAGNRRPTKLAHDEANVAIIEALDVVAEYQSLGVTVTGAESRGDGWLECRAVEREDINPSAAINVRTGRYKDLGGLGLSLSLWDFAARTGRFATWQEARKHYAAVAKVSLPAGRPPANPTDHLEWQAWSEPLVAMWCRHKPGVTPEAVRAFGGRLARYRGQYTVVAVPVFGAAGPDADPIGWTLFNISGQPLPIFHPGDPPTWEKMKTTAGSQAGLIGPPGIFGPPTGPTGSAASTIQTIWKVEGPSDAMAFWAAMPPDVRDVSHFVATNSNGANEIPKPSMAGPFAGRRVIVIHDADEPGESGVGKNWIPWLLNHGPIDVRHVRLPFAIEKNHGKDLRDFFAGGGTFADLLVLADRAEAVKSPAAGGPDSGVAAAVAGQTNEADDDPHRLAGVFLAQHAHADGPKLRFWKQEWWLWNGRRYCKLDDATIRGMLTRAVKAEFDRINLEELERAKSRDGDALPEVQKVTQALVFNVLGSLSSIVAVDFDVDTQGIWLSPYPAAGRKGPFIAMENGILDVGALLDRSDDFLLPLTPLWFSPTCFPYPFDSTATVEPRWVKILEENLDYDAERVAILQEWAGYLLTPDTNMQRFLVLDGEGSNGKSVFLAGLEAILGKDNVSHVPLEDFGQRFALTMTLGKLANLAADCGELDKVAEGYLKSFTSGDRRFFDKKNVAGVDARPTARMIMATNNKPRFSDRSDGLWRRMQILPFLTKVDDSRKVRGMDKAHYWLDSGELPAMFLWAVRGLDRLKQNGDFTFSRVCHAALAEYRTEINPAREFFEEMCIENSLESIATNELYATYRKWCIESGYKPLGKQQFGKEVGRKFPELSKRKVGPRNDRFSIYEGIGLRMETLQ